MNALTLIIRLFLFTLLGVAGVAKLLDVAGSRKAMKAFGLPNWSIPVLSWFIPVIELILAVALLPANTVAFGAIGTTALFAVFAVGVGFNFARGNKAGCACFGRLQAQPISGYTVARNVALTMLAALLVSQLSVAESFSFIGWIGDLTIGERVNLVVGVLGIALLIIVAVLLVRLLEQQRRLIALVDDKVVTIPSAKANVASPGRGLPLGSPAPDFDLPEVDGERHIALRDLVEDRRPVLLTFMTPDCSVCDDLAIQMVKWSQKYSKRLRMAIISTGSFEENARKFAASPLDYVLVQNGAELDKAYHARWLPSAVLVNSERTIGSRVANGFEEIESLVLHVVESENAVPWMGDDLRQLANEEFTPILFGAAAPEFSSFDLEGKPVHLRDYRGRKILLVFLSPTCPFCTEAIEDLKTYEAISAASPELVIVCEATAEEARKLGLRSRIVIDEEDRIARDYVVYGKPSAILIDENGLTASLLEEGAHNFLPLIGRAPQTGAD